MANLKELRGALRTWNWRVFGDLERQVAGCQKEVENADFDLQNQWTLQGEERLKRAQADLELKLKAKFQLLEEKSRMAWLKEGDRNSALFHTAMKVRRARSRVHIELPDGSWTEDRDKIGPAAVSVFQNLLGPTVSPDVAEVLDVIPTVISTEENSFLVRMPSMQELKEVVWSIDVSSAPGPDGFTSLFYRHCWSVICDDLLAAVRWFFKPGSYLPASVTATYLTLIPKSAQPRSLGDLRPISLCNVIHKIVSKLLNTRLRPLLPRLVGPEQAAFIEGRNIHENIVLAQEVCRDINKKVWGGNIMLKLDMSKAYDRISWAFITRVLRRFGFSEVWCDLIYRNLCGCMFSVKWDGKLYGYFRSYCGVRQGDPLSPSLFVLALDVLGRLLIKNVAGGNIRPFHCEKRAAPPSHLMFADDVLIFSNGSANSIRRLRDVLEEFCEASGQVVNHSKSAVYFSKCIPASRRAVVLGNSGFVAGSFPFTYLGVPIFPGRPKIEYFDDLVAKVRSRVEGWLGKLISFGGRMTLIQSVLSAATAHVLASTAVPQVVLQRISTLLASFLWNAGREKRLHWVSWGSVCRPSSEGGLGFRSMHQIMDGFHAKLAWSFWAQESLLARFLAAKYGHPSLISSAPQRGSAVWSRIRPLALLLRSRVNWVLGNGELALQHAFPSILFSSDVAECPVKEVMEDPSLMALCPSDVQVSLSRVRLVGRSPDRLVWPDSVSGRFSIGGFLSMIYPLQGGRDFEWIWAPWIPRKIGGFLWRLFNNAVPVDNRVQGKGISLCSKCRCCAQGHCESVDHLFISGELAQSVWRPLAAILDKPRAMTIFQLRWSWVGSGTAKSQYDFVSGAAVGCGLWEIWCARNRRIHESGQVRVDLFRAVRSWLVRLLHLFPPKVSASVGERLSLESLCLPVLSGPVGRFRWVAWDPGPGITLNTDGSAGPRGSSGGGVVRDVVGKPLLLFASRFIACSSVVAEFEAARRGIYLARERGLLVTELQSDSKILVDALAGEGDCPWSCVYIYRDIMRELDGVRVVHIFREANRVADRLARFALEVGPLVGTSMQSFGSEVCEALRGDGFRFRELRRR